MELKVPEFWTFMLARLFGVRSPKLSAKLWAHYPKSTVLIWQLHLCDEPASPQAVVDRIKRLGELLEPQLLIRAAEKVAEPGRSRPKELLEFEERVLYLTTRDGHIRW